MVELGRGLFGRRKVVVKMAMYEKNLSEDLRLRLSKQDMDFLRELSNERVVSVSECIRSIIGEYRRSLESMKILDSALKLTRENLEKIKKGEKLSYGDTETDIDN